MSTYKESSAKRLESLTLEEKATLTSGADFWNTPAIPEKDIPSAMLTDGPHGLRKQVGSADHLGINESVPATCFPPAVGLGSSWDPELAERIGQALGTESVIEDVAVLLGPGINIKRSPLCGRNFEYFSEDPLVAGHLGAGLVAGIQSKGVGTSLKHFAANNQETDRMRVSADVDERTLREIYLRGFEYVVKKARPWTVMCSYNRINGVYASEDPWLLTNVLRGEWDFDGMVISDWGAVNDRVAGLIAGMDLEMPSSSGEGPAAVLDAIKTGGLTEDVLDRAVRRFLELLAKTEDRISLPGPLDVDSHHALAREAAGRSIVLLKNEGNLLPLDPASSVAVIGAFAQTPRYQGAGSSMINPTKLDRAIDEIRALAQGEVSFSPGFTIDGSGDAAALRADAAAAAKSAQTAVVFLGLPDSEESEGFDRHHLNLPAAQLELLDEVRAANPKTVVVLSNGGVVLLPFRDQVPAIVEGWLLGQAGGGATADVLYGVVNPSGHLTETIPLRLEDSPSYGNFPGELGHVRYGEGVLVGYRGYDARKCDVAYPFGYGLSYTTFEYGHAQASITSAGDIEVTVELTNTGARAGREVVQVYTSLTSSAVQRAPRELKAFQSVLLDAGESENVRLTVRREDLAYWDRRVDAWIVEEGEYSIAVAASSRDIRSVVTVNLEGDPINVSLDMNSSVADMLRNPTTGPILESAFAATTSGDPGGSSAAMDQQAIQTLMESLPIGRIARFPGTPVTSEQIQQLIAKSKQ